MAWRQHGLPKYQVKKIAELLHLNAVPRHNYGTPAPDAENRYFVVECKARDHLPRLVLDALTQVEKYVEHGDRRIPIAIFHQIGGNYTEDVVCVKLRHFRKLAAFFYAAVNELGELPAELQLLASDTASIYVASDTEGPGEAQA